ncbi:MAG: molecular chaperone DnaJ [Candidatus Geothermincolia bacterium]
MEDHYKVLGVRRNADAHEIKKAYRALARKHHPDVSGSVEEEHFKRIGKAYEVLSDPERRSRYDAYGDDGNNREGGFGGGMHHPFEDIFEMFMGRGGRSWQGPERGSDLAYQLTLTLREAAVGHREEIEIPVEEPCADCEGTGVEKGYNLDICPECGGSGTRVTSRNTVFGSFSSRSACRRCAGSGHINTHPCPACRGTGGVATVEKVEAEIPAGVDDGDRLRLAGKGAAGNRGGGRGDLYVIIDIAEDPVFRREGTELFQTVRLSMFEAALGTEVKVPTLEGDESLKVPAGTQPGTLFRLRHKGMPGLRTHGHGDMHVSVEVEIPLHLSEEQRDLLTRAKAANPEGARENRAKTGKGRSAWR